MIQMKQTRNKCLIVDFYYRNWLFLVLLGAELITFTITQPTTTHPRHYLISPSSSSSSICSHLTDNFRFDFALNQHIRRYSAHEYNHFLVSRHHLLRFTIPDTTVQIREEKLANETLLGGIDYDIGFSLWGEHDSTTKMCFLKYIPGNLTCLALDHYNHRPLSDPGSLKEIIPKKSFHLSPSYYPTVAFQDVRFTDFENSLYQVVFLEQTLEPQKNLNSTTRSFARHLQVFSFQFSKDNDYLTVVNLTDSAPIPDYIWTVPRDLEITGVFNWKSKAGRHEFVVLAWDGREHLYCTDDGCDNRRRYRSYLGECRGPNRTQGPKDEETYTWAINHHPKYEAKGAEGTSFIDVITSEGLHSKNKSYSVYLLSGMFFLLVCLGLLLLGVCYYSVKEVQQQEKQVRKVYEKSILLTQVSSKQAAIEANGGEMISSSSPIPSRQTMTMTKIPLEVILESRGREQQQPSTLTTFQNGVAVPNGTTVIPKRPPDSVKNSLRLQHSPGTIV